MRKLLIDLTLENLEVLQIGIFGINVELDPSHGNIVIDAVEDLAESSTMIHLCQH